MIASPRQLPLALLAFGTLALPCAMSPRSTGRGLLAEEPPPVVAADHAARMKAGTALFKDRVRAILVENCLKCHGGEQIKGDFDLSSREALLASGMVDAEGDAASSHLFAVLTHEAEPHMPQNAPKLSDESLELIKRWLDLGAAYDKPLADGAAQAARKSGTITAADRDYWAFRPLAPVVPPAVRDATWVRTDVDRFILAALEQRELHPNPLADRRTLIRRAYYDLLGLPPTPEQIAAFVQDPAPDAYERLLDQLLESPHYGERWARHWMDIARFAESHGYEQDYDRPHAYPYRDFLIKAFNADMPYDQFVRWQIAGDELAPDNPLAMTATGFLGAGAFPTQLTEAEFETSRYDELDDMATTLGTAILGLSVGCARCHDHKYDPIPATDYYRLISAFTTTIRSEIELDLNPAENAQRRADFAARREELQRELARYEREELPAALRVWLQTNDPQATAIEPWQLLDVVSVTSSGGTQYVRQEDGSWLAQGTAPPQESITIEARLPPGPFSALRIEALTHDSLPQRGPGRADNGNFVLGDLPVELTSGDAAPPEKLTFAAARATHQQNADSLSVAATLDADQVSGWAVDAGGIGKDQAAVFDLAEPRVVAADARLKLTLVCPHPNTKHSLGRFRVSYSAQPGQPPVVGGAGIDPRIREALVRLRENFDTGSADLALALTWFARAEPGWRERQQALEQHERAGSGAKLTKVQVTSEGLPHMTHHADDRGFPHFYPETYFLTRGDVHQKKELVTPSYLQVLMRDGYGVDQWQVPPPEGWTRTSLRRASLANWLLDVDHGAGQLAARVIVNRLWQHHFGRGIVATPSDFGTTGEPPTHPELLDWLAGDLVRHGWRLKRLHKLIMTSAAYMQTTQADEARLQVDRENLYWWRRLPRRLEAEAIRDGMLAVSGLLDPTMFGPGTLDESMRRRSVYFFIKRSQLIPLMMLFDWPEHLVGIGQRSVTTIAPQALAFLNHPQCRTYAEGLARRVASMPTDECIRRAYELAFGRLPTDRERERAQQFLARQAAQYLAAGRSDDEAKATALTDFCQTLLSMNEFVYIN